MGRAGLLPPGAEVGEERLAGGGRDIVLPQPADGGEGAAHLVQVVAAPRTAGEVRLETGTLRVRQGVLQVVGNQLDEFLTAQIVRDGAYGVTLPPDSAPVRDAPLNGRGGAAPVDWSR